MSNEQRDLILELVAIDRELRRAFNDYNNTPVAARLSVAMQLQRNALANDTVIVLGDIADALNDMRPQKRNGLLPGERKLN